MKKLVYLALLLPFIACKKNSNPAPSPPPPDITESLSLSIVNLNPDAYDSARGHVSDTFSWSVPNAYGDTGIITNGIYIPPPNASTLILEGLIYGYGTGGAILGQNRLLVNKGTDFTTAGLTIALPSDTTNSSLGYPYADFPGGSMTFADTVPIHQPPGSGLYSMLLWWRGTRLPVSDSVVRFVDIHTNPLELTIRDTLTVTSRAYIGRDLVVSGTFSEEVYTALAFPYSGSFCRKTWYLKGTFSNMIYVFKPD